MEPRLKQRKSQKLIVSKGILKQKAVSITDTIAIVAFEIRHPVCKNMI